MGHDHEADLGQPLAGLTEENVDAPLGQLAIDDQDPGRVGREDREGVQDAGGLAQDAEVMEPKETAQQDAGILVAGNDDSRAAPVARARHPNQPILRVTVADGPVG